MSLFSGISKLNSARSGDMGVKLSAAPHCCTAESQCVCDGHNTTVFFETLNIYDAETQTLT